MVRLSNIDYCKAGLHAIWVTYELRNFFSCKLWERRSLGFGIGAPPVEESKLRRNGRNRISIILLNSIYLARSFEKLLIRYTESKRIVHTCQFVCIIIRRQGIHTCRGNNAAGSTESCVVVIRLQVDIEIVFVIDDMYIYGGRSFPFRDPKSGTNLTVKTSVSEECFVLIFGNCTCEAGYIGNEILLDVTR